MADVPDVTDSTFAADVLQRSEPVVVDFWAPWCHPCRMIAPSVAQIAAEHADTVRVVRLNIDENPETVRAYGVQSIPTVSVFVGGKVVKSVTGGRSKSMLLKDLAEYL